MPLVTRYQLWQHAKSRELWAVRLEFDTLTGVFGPLEAPARSVDLSGLLYEEHPDAYKNIDDVVESLEQAAAATRVAMLVPMLTVKR